MTRLKAFSIHLAISAAIAAAVIALMLLLWYAPPFFSALGGQHVLLILLGVDATLGPLFTLIIFNPLKTRKALTFDLSVIALVQAAALVYGMGIVFQARPVFVVYSKGSFDLVTANMLSKNDIAKAGYPDYRSLPLTGPKYVSTAMPASIRDRNEVVLGAFSGKDLPLFPQYYMPYEQHQADAAQLARPIAELRKLNPGSIAEIDAALRNSKLDESKIGFLPLKAKYQDQAVLVDSSDGKILEVLPVKPWTPVTLIPVR